jgi:hypothetical protein
MPALTSEIGKRDAGVAAGGFHDAIARPQETALFALIENVRRDSVFDAPARVRALKLAKMLSMDSIGVLPTSAMVRLLTRELRALAQPSAP